MHCLDDDMIGDAVERTPWTAGYTSNGNSQCFLLGVHRHAKPCHSNTYNVIALDISYTAITWFRLVAIIHGAWTTMSFISRAFSSYTCSLHCHLLDNAVQRIIMIYFFASICFVFRLVLLLYFFYFRGTSGFQRIFFSFRPANGQKMARYLQNQRPHFVSLGKPTQIEKKNIFSRKPILNFSNLNIV